MGRYVETCWKLVFVKLIELKKIFSKNENGSATKIDVLTHATE